MSSSSTMRFIVPALIAVAVLAGAADVSGQTNRRRRTPATPVSSPTPPATEPMVISRADEFPDENSQAVPVPAPESTPATGADRSSIQTLEDLGNRIRNLEAGRKTDPDEKQKRLLLNLDILTRAEQRSESLRKQVFEMIEKENNVKTKLDTIDYDLRPEVIERTTAIIGSLRPEEIRASRRRSLESEKTNLQTLLTEIQRTRGALEVSLQRADALVEKLRLKFEKEIDTALEEDPEDNNPSN